MRRLCTKVWGNVRLDRGNLLNGPGELSTCLPRFNGSHEVGRAVRARLDKAVRSRVKRKRTDQGRSPAESVVGQEGKPC